MTAETATAILANLTTVLVAVAAGARWVWKSVQARLEAIEADLWEMRVVVSLLVEAEAGRDPAFFEKAKRFRGMVGKE